MHKQILKGLLAVTFAVGGAAAYAADVTLGGTDSFCDALRGESMCLSVSLSGKIEPGDAQKLQREVDRVQAYNKGLKFRISNVFLNSPGGSVAAGMELGRFIRSRQIGTHVAQGDTCASSCVLVLAAGVKRMPEGRVVVHSFYSPEILGTNDFTRADMLYTQVAEQVGAYLKEMRVSNLLLEEMMRVPHSTVRQLEVEQLIQWGLMGLDPVYAQARKRQ